MISIPVVVSKFPQFQSSKSTTSILRSALTAIRKFRVLLPMVLGAQMATAFAADGAGRARFSWDAVPDQAVAGYKVHWGTASGVYTNSADAGNSTELIVSSFTEGVTYFAAISAYGVNGEQSEFSAEYSFVYASTSASSVPVDMNSDSDGDGIPYLLEYALLGGDPAVPSQGVVPQASVLSVDSREYLSLTVRKNPAATGVSYVVECSDDLATWVSGPQHTVVVSDSSDLLVVRDLTPVDSSARRFIRLRVSTLP